MPWKIVVYDSCEAAMKDQGVDSFFKLRPGTVYAHPILTQPEWRENLGVKYLARESQRPPIMVVLPGKSFWCPDQHAYDGDRGYHGDGWDVSGYPDSLTCTPSINAVGVYHGFVQNGFLTDDCEGRKFNDDGTPDQE